MAKSYFDVFVELITKAIYYDNSNSHANVVIRIGTNELINDPSKLEVVVDIQDVDEAWKIIHHLLNGDGDGDGDGDGEGDGESAVESETVKKGKKSL